MPHFSSHNQSSIYVSSSYHDWKGLGVFILNVFSSSIRMTWFLLIWIFHYSSSENVQSNIIREIFKNRRRPLWTLVQSQFRLLFLFLNRRAECYIEHQCSFNVREHANIIGHGLKNKVNSELCKSCFPDPQLMYRRGNTLKKEKEKKSNPSLGTWTI